MIHLKPAEGTSRFLCCFQSSLMLPPGDSVTDDPAKVDCAVEVPYEAFEKLLAAPMDRYNTMGKRVQELIWEMLVDRRMNNAFQVLPEKRRDFLEEFGKRLRKMEDDEDGKDTLLMIRKEQVKELKRIAKGFRDHSAKLSDVLIKVLHANPPFPLEDIPPMCPAYPKPCEHKDCAQRAAMVAHNVLAREIEKLLTIDPLT